MERRVERGGVCIYFVCAGSIKKDEYVVQIRVVRALYVELCIFANARKRCFSSRY